MSLRPAWFIQQVLDHITLHSATMSQINKFVLQHDTSSINYALPFEF